ncbi:hypothetical protein GCM10010833_28800 [Blastomonas aquatica]|uniref:Uncharacterized protein n=1 Tax=Blastomonas aquatica TaxID=1510276 RepID=A0ABQ1JNX9_9SPHN|nr:hypothetical protein GCM10010833_28800 [Blastomonas aquatica]
MTKISRTESGSEMIERRFHANPWRTRACVKQPAGNNSSPFLRAVGSQCSKDGKPGGAGNEGKAARGASLIRNAGCDVSPQRQLLVVA